MNVIVHILKHKCIYLKYLKVQCQFNTNWTNIEEECKVHFTFLWIRLPTLPLSVGKHLVHSTCSVSASQVLGAHYFVCIAFDEKSEVTEKRNLSVASATEFIGHGRFRRSNTCHAQRYVLFFSNCIST